MAAIEKTQATIPRQGVSLPEQLSSAQIHFLTRKTPSEYIKQRTGPGGAKLDYVEVGYIVDLLNKAFGWDWDFIITSEQIGKRQVWVRGELIVRFSDRIVTKSQYGGAVIKVNKSTQEPFSIADDLKAAASDSLKKCASLLGVAGDVYWQDLDKDSSD